MNWGDAGNASDSNINRDASGDSAKPEGSDMRPSGKLRLDARAAIAPQAVDTQIIDAYSQAMSNVAQAALPAVVAVGPPQRSSEWFAHATGGRQDAQPRGMGSGVIISSDGLALTNSHVVMGQKSLSVRTSDGDLLAAEVLGDDPSSDLAVLKLRGTSLPFAVVLPESAGPVRVAQTVLAVGSPFGLASTVSSGMVSALGRSLRGQDGRLIEGVIQHTAPINPGNSGGPLLDSRGRIVGINTAIIAMSQNVGFAVSHEVLRAVVPQLITHGAVRRVRLGISITGVPLPREVVRKLDLLNDSGVGVMDVESQSIAAKAGVRAGDVIVGVGGAIVQTPDELARALARFATTPNKGAANHAAPRPQRDLTLVVIRDGRALADVVVRLAA